MHKLLLRIHEETSSQWNWQLPAKRVFEINLFLRGWCGYLIGSGGANSLAIRRYSERRFRRWLMRREQRHGTGYKQHPDAYLYETLGLYQLPTSRVTMLKAKT